MSLMKTETELDGDKMAEETEGNFSAKFNNDKSELQGAAPMLANMSLGYSTKWQENSLHNKPCLQLHF